MSELTNQWLEVSRRGIVHIVQTLNDDTTICGKWTRDLVLIGGIGTGERMCHTCNAMNQGADQ